MDSALTTVALPLALGIIMFGLGLSLTLDDFRRVAKAPKAVAVALVCQLVLLPLICFGLVKALDLPPLLAVGMMLLAASPGGTTREPVQPPLPRRRGAQRQPDRGELGDRDRHAAADHQPRDQPLRPRRRRSACRSARSSRCSRSCWCRSRSACWCAPRSAAFADRMDRPVRIGSAVILAVLVLGDPRRPARERRGTTWPTSGSRPALFCAISLVVGYFVPRALGVREDAGDRVVDGDRRPQRDAGDLRRGRGAGQHRDLGPGRGLLALHVRVRDALGAAAHQEADSRRLSRSERPLRAAGARSCPRA